MRIILREMPGSTYMVSPLVLAIQSRYLEDPDQEAELPTTIQALLFGHAARLMILAYLRSPLCEAIRSGDDIAILLLLQHNACPSVREKR